METRDERRASASYDLGGLDYAAFVWDHRIYRELFLAALVILVYDHFLVFDDELRLIWRRGRLTPSTGWYLLVRCTSLLCSAVAGVFYFADMDRETCVYCRSARACVSLTDDIKMREDGASAGMVACLPGVFVTLFLRVFAMYNRSIWVLAPIQTVATLNLALGLWTIVKYGHPRMLSAPRELGITGCHTAIPRATGWRLGGTWIAQMFSDTIVFGLTVFRAWKDQTVIKLVPGSLISRMARDGAIYFGIIVLANLANVLTCFLGDILIAGLLSWWTTSLSVTLICRLILSLQGMAEVVRADTDDLDETELEGIHFVAPGPGLPGAAGPRGRLGPRERASRVVDSVLRIMDDATYATHTRTATRPGAGPAGDDLDLDIIEEPR
ncbi:hypothetical protein HMN09_00378200 [Mycena chlorophos]|uniref:DUF6533 domain-containing protein n=1 Tax=Mycena chlorophos TaxID=658473 RepID=A0A8H6TGW9_MYCCL|nr:hypothetical protein HMN09_00378200 [Mycena chlorophos]